MLLSSQKNKKINLTFSKINPTESDYSDERILKFPKRTENSSIVSKFKGILDSSSIINDNNNESQFLPTDLYVKKLDRNDPYQCLKLYNKRMNNSNNIFKKKKLTSETPRKNHYLINENIKNK